MKWKNVFLVKLKKLKPKKCIRIITLQRKSILFAGVNYIDKVINKNEKKRIISFEEN